MNVDRIINLNILWLLILLIGCSGNQQSSVSEIQETNNAAENLLSGLNIEYGPNLGTGHTDTLGIKHLYLNATAIITNNNTIPIQLQFALSKEYAFPTLCGNEKYKVFLLPEELTPDTARIYNNITTGDDDFLNTFSDNPQLLNKTINPGEYCVVTVATLNPNPKNCNAVPRAIFSYKNKDLYQTCEGQINEAISTDPQLEISLKLEFYKERKFIEPDDGCVIIPFGQISYAEQ